MENDFHLSIKNHQRKIGDVRDLFRNLTNDEKQCLLKEKILCEQKTYELRILRELEERQIIANSNQDFLKRSKYNNYLNNFQNFKMNEDIENNNKLTDYEEQVIKTYGLLNQQANDDFGKYLEDDEDDDNDNYDKEMNSDKKIYSESNDGQNIQSSKKIRKNSSAKANDSSDSLENEKQTKEYQVTDMCGFYAMELSPKEKERMEKLKQQQQQQNKGGFAGLKNKIKSLFTLEDNSYNLQAPTPAHTAMGYDDVELSGLDSEDIKTHNYYLPRTINDIQYGSSKIGYQNDEEGYKEYYNQVDDLRKFDEEARVNNLKWRPNDNIAIMDDDLNVKYTKSKHLSKESNSKKTTSSEKSTKKQTKFNKLTEAIISKAKSLRT
jgi:hypothetical protein